MADISRSIAKVLQHEGGYANNPDDPGGETNFGISKRSHPTLDIKHLTRVQAMEIYLKQYTGPLYQDIPSQIILDTLVDYGVTSSPRHAVEDLQRAVNRVIAGPCAVDGSFGPETLAQVTAACALDDGADELCLEFTRRRILFYYSLPEAHNFFTSWLNRSLDW